MPEGAVSVDFMPLTEPADARLAPDPFDNLIDNPVLHSPAWGNGAQHTQSYSDIFLHLGKEDSSGHSEFILAEKKYLYQENNAETRG